MGTMRGEFHFEKRLLLKPKKIKTFDQKLYGQMRQTLVKTACLVDLILITGHPNIYF